MAGEPSIEPFIPSTDTNSVTGYKLKKIYIWVPSEYQQVEYIESSGTGCCLNTGIQPKNSPYFKVEFKMNPTTLKNGNNYFYGANSTPRCSFENGSDAYWNVANTTVKGNHNISIGNDYEYSCTYNNGTFTSSGAYNGSFTYSGTQYGTGDFCFFCRGADGGAQSAEKLYYLKLYQGENFDLVRDFIPCYRKSDGVIGFYDRVEGKFYANSLTGTFTKGADVTSDIMVEKQVRPTQPTPTTLELYYDLRDGSLVDLQAAGFDELWTNGSYTFASDGLQQTSSSNDRGIWIIKRGLDLTNAKKLIAYSVGKWQYASWSNGKEIKLATAVPTGGTLTNPRRDTYFTYSNNSGYRNSELPYVNASGTSTVLARGIATSASGEDTITLTIDFENKTIEWKVAGTNNYILSANLTDEQYNATRNMTAIYWGWGRGFHTYDSYERLKEVYLKIEY